MAMSLFFAPKHQTVFLIHSSSFLKRKSNDDDPDMGKVKEPGDVNDPNICVPELDS
jgi:hypothetical protein